MAKRSPPSRRRRMRGGLGWRALQWNGAMSALGLMVAALGLALR